MVITDSGANNLVYELAYRIPGNTHEIFEDHSHN